MLVLPTPVLDYIYALTIENYSPAYLLIAKDGRLSSWGGELAMYGVGELQKGEYIGKQMYFLEGLLPLDSSPMSLPCLKLENGLSADVHLFPGDGADWVLLLDATLKDNQHSLIQQKSNDLNLLRQRQSRVLNQFLGGVNENLAQKTLTLQVTEERKDVTILFANICSFTYYSKNSPTNIVFKTLNLYLSSMLQPILDKGGVVDKIMGDKVMALFGVLPSTESPPTQAIKAALCMIEAVKDVSKLQQVAPFEIGIGITSGSVALGIVGSKNRRTLSAISCCVDLAMYLGSQSRLSEILIDGNTFNKIGSMQKYFSETTFSDKGVTEQAQTYSYLVR